VKVCVVGEDFPIAGNGGAADQKIDSGSGNALATAFIAPVRRLADAGEQFLPNRPDQPGPAVLDQLPERRNLLGFAFAEAAAVSPQSERPDAGIHKHLHLSPAACGARCIPQEPR
jgi:hypothetical protein